MPFLKFVWVFFLREKQLQTNTSDLELRGDSVAPQNQSKSRFAYCWDTLNLNHGKETQASVFFRQPCARILTDEMDPKRSTKGPRVSWAYDLELLHHCSPDFNTSTRLLFAPRVLWLSELLVTLWLSHLRFLWQDIIPNISQPVPTIPFLWCSPLKSLLVRLAVRGLLAEVAIAVLRLPSSYQSPLAMLDALCLGLYLAEMTAAPHHYGGNWTHRFSPASPKSSGKSPDFIRRTVWIQRSVRLVNSTSLKAKFGLYQGWPVGIPIVILAKKEDLSFNFHQPMKFIKSVDGFGSS